MRLLFALLALIVSIATASQNDTCYFPNESVAAYNGVDYVPCKEVPPSGGVSYCCYPDDICTSEGYCIGDAGVFYRGGCTDKTWTSGLCPVLCAKANMGGFANFYPCTPGKFTHDNWTCDGNGSDDDNCNGTTFRFETGNLFVPQGVAAKAANTVTLTSPATAIASTPTKQGSCSNHNSSVTGMGVGLGVSLGLLATAALLGYILERKKRKAAEKIVIQARVPGGYQMYQSGYSSDKMAHEAGSQTLHEIGNSPRPP